MKRFGLFFLLISVCSFSFAQVQENADSLIFQNFLKYAEKEKIAEKETGYRIISIARFFLDTPYVASTLEGDDSEYLRVNFRELDCTTFVETVLALHHVLKEAKPDYEAYKRVLTSIRYRNGYIAGYPSRLHYTTDWLFDNQRKGFINFVKMGYGSVPFKTEVDFMSTHPDLYPALKNNPGYVEEMAKNENRIHGLSLKYLPKDKLSAKAKFIHIGDIIAITTDHKGLDFSHLGFAVRENGLVYLLHASSTGKKVLISAQSLKDYLSDVKKHTGIVVVRPL
jgi:hypothetical protein